MWLGLCKVNCEQTSTVFHFVDHKNRESQFMEFEIFKSRGEKALIVYAIPIYRCYARCWATASYPLAPWIILMYIILIVKMRKMRFRKGKLFAQSPSYEIVSKVSNLPGFIILYFQCSY